MSCAGVSSFMRGKVVSRSSASDRSRLTPSYTSRQIRPLWMTLSRSYCSMRARRYVPRPDQVACWMMPWYMSVMYSVPSGAVV